MYDMPLLKTPGEMISEAREAQGLTLAQLSERTKIPPKVLASLELDEYHKISGPLYIKSFLRTCAMDLGLEPEVVLGLYQKISGEKKPGAPGEETVWGEDEVKVSRIGLPWLQIVMVVGVAAVLIGLVLFAMRGCGHDGDPAMETAAPEKVPATISTGVDREIETLIPPETKEALLERAAVDSASENRTSTQDLVVAAPDTLALGWILNPEIPEGAKAHPAASPPDKGSSQANTTSAAVPEKSVERARENPPVKPSVVQTEKVEASAQTQPSADKPVVITGPAPESKVKTLVPAPAGWENSSWPLVLSIVCRSPQKIQVKRDGDRTFSDVRWPADGQEAGPVPDAGFEAGRAYRQDGRLVVFWGAEDHFSLILARPSAASVAVNGRPHDLGRLKPGQELVLDAHAADPEADR